MGYLVVWKVFEEMITDLRKKGLVVSAEVMNDLKSARTIINVLEADPSYGDAVQKVEEYFSSLESYLVSEGQKKLGTEHVDAWFKRLSEARSRIFEEEKEKTRFVHGVPREHEWIRIKPVAELPVEKLKELISESNLSYTVQEDGCLLVHGSGEQIKKFVKKIAIKHDAGDK